MKFSRFGRHSSDLLRIALIPVLAGLSWSASQEGPNGTLKIFLIDKETGNPVPARVEVLDDEGHGQIAEDALLVGSRHPGLFKVKTTGCSNSRTAGILSSSAHSKSGRRGFTRERARSESTRTSSTVRGRVRFRFDPAPIGFAPSRDSSTSWQNRRWRYAPVRPPKPGLN